MTRLEGKPLRQLINKADDIWPELSIEQQKSIVNKIVEYVSQLHNKIPRSNQIGNYKLRWSNWL